MLIKATIYIRLNLLQLVISSLYCSPSLSSTYSKEQSTRNIKCTFTASTINKQLNTEARSLRGISNTYNNANKSKTNMQIGQHINTA